MSSDNPTPPASLISSFSSLVSPQSRKNLGWEQITLLTVISLSAFPSAHFFLYKLFIYENSEKILDFLLPIPPGSCLQHFKSLPPLSSWTSSLILSLSTSLGLEFGENKKLGQWHQFPKNQTLGLFSNIKASLSGQD